MSKDSTKHMIRKFNEHSEQSDFETLRKGLLFKLDRMVEEYEDFTNDVSPKHWRTTGHHLTELRKMREDILRMSEITPDEKEIDWVKKSRFQ